MTVFVATRLSVRRLGFLPQFLAGSLAVAWQAHRSSGFRGGRLRMEAGVFWTLTSWESGGDVARFTRAGVHAWIAPRLAHWGSAGVIGVWTAQGGLPDWDEVARRTAAHPRFTPLDHPGRAHEDTSVIAPRAGLDLPIPMPRRRARLSP